MDKISVSPEDMPLRTLALAPAEGPPPTGWLHDDLQPRCYYVLLSPCEYCGTPNDDALRERCKACDAPLGRLTYDRQV